VSRVRAKQIGIDESESIWIVSHDSKVYRDSVYMGLSKAQDLAVGPPHHIYALSDLGSVYRFLNGNWTLVDSPPAQKISVGSNGKLYITVTGGKIFETSEFLALSKNETKYLIDRC